ncbi:MAG: M48 family metallopeptidase [Muribaculaceae bacterium]|nr:M48 family metallopeptidase [Muribaculaceae bacterium]
MDSNNSTYELNPTLPLERQVAQQIYTALQGDVVNEVLKQLDNSKSDTWWRSNMEGHSLKVAKELLPDIYELCNDVKRKLNYTDKVDFYITGDSTVNAFSVASEKEDEPNIVNINSGLFDLMSTDELRFVIGHELGHLINKDTELSRLIGFVFPDEAVPPITLIYKIRLHAQLAELVADRYGYMATENLETCVTAFFKMASGLDLAKMNVSLDALLEDNTRRLDYFLNDKGLSRATHPVNPIRVQALNLFANSKNQQELDEGMDKLISILLKVGDSEQDKNLAAFIASAGLIVANSDGCVAKEEVDRIIEHLATLQIFPMRFLDMINQNDVGEIFNTAVNNLMNINPGLRVGMLQYMIDIVMADKNIDKQEVELINNFGANIGFSPIEIAEMIASSIQQKFVPSLDSIV